MEKISVFQCHSSVNYAMNCEVEMAIQIAVSRERIAEFCRSNHIRRMALFGSVLRDDFSPESDVDVLVEFEQGVHIGLRFFSIEQELSEIFGRKVDLNTSGFLSRDFRQEVLDEAEVLYEAT